MPVWRSLRLSYKLLAAFVLLGVLPLLAVGGFAYRTAAAALDTSASRNVEEVAYNASDKLDRNLFDRYNDAQAFAASDAARSMDAAKITDWMDTTSRLYAPTYKLMVVANTAGRIIAVNSAGPDGKPLGGSLRLIGKDVSQESWFKPAASGALKERTTAVEDLHHDPLLALDFSNANGADLAMSFSAPIKSASGQIVGVWSNRFNWEVAAGILSDVEQRAHDGGAGSVRLAIASANGLAIAAPEAGGVLNQSLADEPALASSRGDAGHTDAKGLSSKQDAIQAWWHSKGYGAYPGVGWTVLATQDRSEALAKADRLRLTIAIASLIAAIELSGAAWLLARSITQPLLRLRNAADSVSNGDVQNLDIEVDSEDEIADLAASFRRMIASLRFLMLREKSDHPDAEPSVL